MSNVKVKVLRCARLLLPLWVIAAYGGMVLSVRAQIPPPNDNLTNAQPILGVTGTITGTNLNATAQPGEPPPVSPANPAGATIWYVWTCPQSITEEFNTRGSTDPYGNPLPTSLAVYASTGTAGAPTFGTLTKVASNQADPNANFAPASRVDFTPIAGRRYYIQVDGAAGTANEGTIVLNWGTSLVGGSFGFSTTIFNCENFDDFYTFTGQTYQDYPQMHPSLRGTGGQGGSQVRVTVTRQNGFVGRNEVTLMVTNTYYGEETITNFVITNVFITNYDLSGNVVSFTNTFYTNAPSETIDQEIIFGFAFPVTTYYDVTTARTNANGVLGRLVTVDVPLGTYNVTNYFTNFPCMPLLGTPVTTSNSTGTGTIISLTNIYCDTVVGTNLVPSAVPGSDYTPFVTNLTFDDYQMSQDVYVQVNPLDIIEPPETSLNLNAEVALILTNAVLDPLENQDILPPTISQTNATLNVQNFFGNPTPGFPDGTNFYTSLLLNSPYNTYSVINWGRATYRVNKNATNAVFYVYCWPPPMSASCSYTIDSALPGITVDDYNRFPTVAGSDYAVPFSGDTNNWDFALPTNNIDKAVTWTGISGTITWSTDDPIPGEHKLEVPINNNGLNEFDQDFYLQLYLTSSQAMSDYQATPPVILGNTYLANCTINFDSVNNSVQPGGAVDRVYNVDNVARSQPPFNPIPGANGPVLAVGIQANGEAVIGGQFTAYNATANNFGYQAQYIATLQTNGLLDGTFNPGSGPDNFVDALAIDSYGRIIIGGGFTSVNGVLASHIARLLPNGNLDTTFNSGFGANATIRVVTLDGAGNILIGGDFTTYNQTNNCNHLARLLTSGAYDTSFSAGSGTDQDVLAIAVDSVGRILIGGPFQYVNGTNYNGVARLLPSGALDTSFNTGSGADGTVYSIVVQANNEVWVAGSFPHFNLVQVGGIALLTPAGALDTGFKPGTGANDVIYAMALQPDGKVLLGGQFTSINGTRRVGVARLLPQGWVDTSFMDTAYNQFAGLINHYYNTNVYNPNDFPASYNSRNACYALAMEPAGNIIIGGSFLQVGGGSTRDDRHNHWNLARLIGPPTSGLQLSNGGLANDPGNITLSPSYSADDTAGSLYLTVFRTNGSLGRANMILATNTFAPGPGSAGSADFGLVNSGAAIYEDVWDIWNVTDNAFGWRESDGFYGPNNGTQTLGDQGASALRLTIKNNKQAQQNLLASLSLIQVTGTNNLFLGGEPIPTGPALGVPTSPLTIINDNYPAGTLGFSATNYGVVESGVWVTNSVLRTNGSFGTVSVGFTTQTGITNDGPTGSVPAQANIDYVPTNGTLTFGPGTLSNGFRIQIIDHSTAQSNKFFNVRLQGPTGGASLDASVPPLVPSNTVVAIIDDHFQPGHLSFTSSSYSVTKGGTATITVVRTGGALGVLSAVAVAANGTAVNGVNYTWQTNVTLTWQNTDITPKTFTVQTLEDNIVEGAKTVNLFLTNALIGGQSPGATTNAGILTVPPVTAVLTIADDDSPGQLSFAAPLLNGAPNFNVLANAGQVLVTVVRSNGTVGTLSATYATFNGTNAIPPLQPALAGTNYGGTNGTLTFGPGITSQTFSVPIYTYTNTANALFNLVLENPNPASTNYPVLGTVTILNTNVVLSPAGGVDTTLGTGVGFDDVVQSLSLQADGKLLAGGNFTHANNYPYNQIARLNTDGSVDTAFLFNMAGADGMVRVILSQTATTGQSAGSIMVGGDFAHLDTIPLSHIGRLNLDGSVDSSFNPGSGADNSVFAIVEAFLPAALSNQPPVPYYYVGGGFANFNGTPAGGIVRLYASPASGNVAGQIDPNFNVGLGVTGTNATVHAVAVQANDQIILGGDFTSFNNGVYHHLVRLNPNGSIDPTFNPDTGANVTGSVRAITIQPDGRILIGGLFTNVNGVPINYLARLNSDGSVDSSFNVGAGPNNLVLAIAVDSQGRILAGGEFTRASGVTRNGLTRLNPDGTIDPSMNFGSGANGFVQSIAIQGNDEINLAGSFSSFNGLPAGNFVRLYGGSISGPGEIEFGQPYYGVMQNATNALITLQRIGGTADASVSMIFSTSDGSGLNGIDYVGVTNTVTFPLGETFETVIVPVLNNFTLSTNKTVNLVLSNPTGVGGGPPTFGPQGTATLIITNSNSGLSFSAPSYRDSENVAAGSAVIPVLRSGNLNSTLTVTVYTGTNDTAVPFINYIPETNTLTFQPGQVTNLFLVPLINATNQFSDLTVDLELTNAIGGFLTSPSSATLTIASVNAGAGVLAFAQTNYVVSEGAGYADITLIRTNGLSGPVSVTLSTSNLTAQAGINYVAYSNTISFVDGQSSQDITNIAIIQLTNAAPNSTVLLTLSNPTGGASIGITNQAVLTIENNIENFSFSSAAYFVNENAGSVTIAILRNGPTNSTQTVSYTTYSPSNAYSTNGYAEPNVDYVPTFGTLTFTPGATLQTIPISILQGTTVNGPATFQVLLQNPSTGAQIGVPGSAIVTIIGDITGFAFATNSYVVAENGSNLVVTVNRFNVNTGTVSVGFGTSDATALAGRDYVATNGTLMFVDGQGTASFTVPILNPNVVESNLTFNLSLFTPSSNAYLLSPSNAAVTITNVLSGISFSSPTYSVSECGIVASIPVVRSGLSNSLASVTFQTLPGGTATAGVNYFPTNVTLTFATNQTVTNVLVQVINNHVIGPDHTVNLGLANVQGALQLNPIVAVLTILECNGAYIVASGTALTGSNQPPTGIIQPGETVTVLFGLRSVAGGGTTNLMATLQTNGGISNPIGAPGTSSRNYGVLSDGANTVFEPFTFTAAATNGQNITATFNLQDGARNLGTVAFGFTVGSTLHSFTNSALITINDATNINGIAVPVGATPYPSIINVAGLAGNIETVTATFSNLSHTYPSDIVAVLVAPNGSNTILMGQVGDGDSAVNVTLTFDQSASVSLPTTQLYSGTYLPTAVGFIPQLPPATNSPVAAPLRPYPTNLSVFAGTPANGSWALFVIDDKPQDVGTMSNGWVLNLGAGNPVAENADLGLSVSTAQAAPTTSNLLVFNLTLTNYGPAGATNVVISDVLPAGLEYLSNNCNCTAGTNGTLTFSVPTLVAGAGVSFNVSVLPLAVGYYTNTITASANQPDLNSNNVASIVLLVSPPTADVGVNLFDSPNPIMVGSDITYTIQVTNGGPSIAVNVVASDPVPAGLYPLSINASAGSFTNASGSIVWTLPSLAAPPAANSASMTIVGQVLAGGTLVDSVSVTSAVYDPYKLNNFASVKTEVDVPSLTLIGGPGAYSLAWPAAAGAFVLAGASNLPPPGTWVLLTNPPPVLAGGQYVYPLPAGGYRFFRLQTQVP